MLAAIIACGSATLVEPSSAITDNGKGAATGYEAAGGVTDGDPDEEAEGDDGG